LAALGRRDAGVHTSESIEKGDFGRIGGHFWKKREMSLVAHCALLLSTSLLYSPPRTETVEKGVSGRGGFQTRPYKTQTTNIEGI